MPRSLVIALFLSLVLLPNTNEAATTRLVINGLTKTSQHDALLLLGNQVDIIISRPPSPSRADDAAFLLQQTLRKNAYPEAVVSWSIPPDGHTIILNVTPGSLRILGSIIITGINDAEIQKKLLSYYKQTPNILQSLSSTKQQIPYLPDNVNTATINATTYLQSLGYWKAKVTISRTRIHPDTGKVDLFVSVHPGPLFKLATPRLLAPPLTHSQLNLTPLRRQLATFTAKTANTTNILKLQSTVLEFFTTQGYTLAKVNLTRSLSGNLVHITLSPHLGKKFKIGSVSVIGLEKTDPAVLQRRFKRIQGRYYNPSLMDINRRKIISTGAFESVLLETNPKPNGTIDLTLRVKEGKARSIGFHLGAGSYEGGIIGVSYYDSNFRGKLQSLATSLEFSGLGLLGRASITEPMFLGSDRSLTLSTFILSHSFSGYKKLETGVGAELVWDLTKHYTLRFYGDLLITKTTATGLPKTTLGYRDYQVLRIGLAQQLDFRNNPISPNKGFHGELITETGIVNASSSISYSRLLLKSSYRLPVGDKQYFLFTGKTGALFNNDPTHFPIDLRFFSGGLESVRSFPKREMVPTIGGNPVGGEAFWLASAEYNRQLTGPLWSNLFFDAGALARRPSELTNTNPKLAVGIGFWLDLPIGPIRAEYGYNLNRQKGEPAGTFHFSIGVSF